VTSQPSKYTFNEKDALRHSTWTKIPKKGASGTQVREKPIAIDLILVYEGSKEVNYDAEQWIDYEEGSMGPIEERG